MALSDGREFLADNRAGRIAPAQLTALQDSYSLKELGLGPVARLLRKDAALGRDLEARVVAHFDGAVKPEERDLKQTLPDEGVLGRPPRAPPRAPDEGVPPPRGAEERRSDRYSSMVPILARIHVRLQTRTPRRIAPRGVLFQSMSGCVLLSHTVTSAVPSALKGLASGFGMGPGVSPSL